MMTLFLHFRSYHFALSFCAFSERQNVSDRARRNGRDRCGPPYPGPFLHPSLEGMATLESVPGGSIGGGTTCRDGPIQLVVRDGPAEDAGEGGRGGASGPDGSGMGFWGFGTDGIMVISGTNGFKAAADVYTVVGGWSLSFGLHISQSSFLFSWVHICVVDELGCRSLASGMCNAGIDLL